MSLASDVGHVRSRPARHALSDHHKQTGHVHLRDLFAADAERGRRCTLAAAGLVECIQAMFRGDAIGTAEQRSVLHVALRTPASDRRVVDGVNLVAGVNAVLARMAVFYGAVRSGRWPGHTGKRIRNVISIGIGIGGPDLGPVTAFEANHHDSQRDLSFGVVSNGMAPVWSRPGVISTLPGPCSPPARRTLPAACPAEQHHPG